jgi:hypothetical protein
MNSTEFRQPALPLQWRRGQVDPVPRQPTPPDTTRLQRWVAQVCTGIAEIAAGARPPTNMHRVVTPAVLARLRLLSARSCCADNAPIRRTTSVRVLHVSAGTVEACAVVQGRQRCQAVAVQLQRRGDRWLVTAAEIR